MVAVLKANDVTECKEQWEEKLKAEASNVVKALTCLPYALCARTLTIDGKCVNNASPIPPTSGASLA